MFRPIRLLSALALLLSANGWAGIIVIHNPTTYRPHLATSATLTHPAPRGTRTAAPATPAPRVLALCGVPLSGVLLDLAAELGWVQIDGDGLGVAIP